jgi:hypothetical protein
MVFQMWPALEVLMHCATYNGVGLLLLLVAVVATCVAEVREHAQLLEHLRYTRQTLII